MLVISLGKENKGKVIEVDKVKQKPTSITLSVEKGKSTEENPYILLGLDKIKHPAIVKTSEGEILEELK